MSSSSEEWEGKTNWQSKKCCPNNAGAWTIKPPTKSDCKKWSHLVKTLKEIISIEEQKAYLWEKTGLSSP